MMLHSGKALGCDAASSVNDFDHAMNAILGFIALLGSEYTGLMTRVPPHEKNRS
jgi:hypothetical protein